MDELIRAAEQDDLTQESQRLENAITSKSWRQDGQSPKRYAGYDALQGAVSVKDHLGGNALITQQGSLSRGAIATGQEVRSYNWHAVDWKSQNDPTLEASLLSSEEVFQTQDANGEGVGNEEDPINPYCAAQCFWYRGQWYRDPAEGQPLMLGQCEGVSYQVDVLVEGQMTDFSTGDVLRTYQFNAFTNPNPALGKIGSLALPGPMVGGLGDRDWPPVSLYVNSSQTLRRLRSNSRFTNYSLNQGNNQVVREISRTVTRVDGLPDDCGRTLPSYGPPDRSDPNRWRAVCSSAPPITYEIDTNSDRTLIQVFDQNGLLITLDFQPNQVEYSVRCKEEGPPPG